MKDRKGETGRRDGCEQTWEDIGGTEGEGGCRQNEKGWRARLHETDQVTGREANTHLHIQTHKGHHAPTALQTHSETQISV